MTYKKVCYKILADICKIIDDIENNLDNQDLVDIHYRLIQIIREAEDIIISSDT